MKATDKNPTLSPAVVLGQQVIQPARGVAEVDATTSQARGHSDVDAAQAQPVRLLAQDASHAASAGENTQLELRRQQRSSGVRTKKLKTESVTSMTRLARQTFHGVHDLVGQARQLLAQKPHEAASAPGAQEVVK